MFLVPIRKLFMFSFLSLILLIQSALGSQNILVGIPAAQSGPAGVADHQDWTNGALMAIEEINANGGVLGKQLEAKIIDIKGRKKFKKKSYKRKNYFKKAK